MLTSSAVGGRKAAPKAPPRRRAAPSLASAPSPGHKGQKASGQSNDPLPEATKGSPAAETSVTPPPPPSPPVVVERPVVGADEPALPVVSVQPAEPLDLRSAGQDNTTNHDSSRGQGEYAESPLEVSPAPEDQETSALSTRKQTRKRTRDAEVDALEGPSKKVLKRSNTRSDAAVQMTQEETEEAGPSSAAAVVRRTQPQRAVRTQPDRDNDAEVQKSKLARHKRLSKAKNAAAAPHSEGEGAALQQPEGTMEEQPESGASPPNKSTRQLRRGRSKAKATTVAPHEGNDMHDTDMDHETEESDPETHRIDPRTLSMYDLSHDNRRGKTSEREKKMAQIDWAAVARKRREEADAIQRGDAKQNEERATVVPSTEGADGTAASNRGSEDRDSDGGAEDEEGDGTQTETRATGGGVRFRLVGGQIVEDETSLTIDRAARVAEAAAQTANDAAEEENDLTVRFNRTTYINARRREETERVPLWKAKSDAWGEEETDRFYEALRMFGTDFFIISKMFPPKTRKQIKSKFVREERLDPVRVNAALLGKQTKQIDLDHYAQAINRDVSDFHKYNGLDHANEVIKASMADKEEAMRAAVLEEEENNRQREVQKQQREKQREMAEKRKEQKATVKAAKKRGAVWGAGTLGGADEDEGEDQD